MTLNDNSQLRHIAIIMDGNRRWAVKRGLSKIAGHRKVMEENVEALIERAGQLGVPYITFWAWSTENWKRNKLEVAAIMKLFRESLKTQAPRLIKKGARLKVIGDISKFPKDIREGIEMFIEESQKNNKITVTFALNYGGRDELLRSFKKLAVEVTRNKLQVTSINQESISSQIDTAGMPDPDMIIRPGGEKRLSGFMLWQSEYSELYFTDVLMPDFDANELDKAIAEYGKRKRRFGGS